MKKYYGNNAHIAMNGQQIFRHYSRVIMNVEQPDSADHLPGASELRVDWLELTYFHSSQ